MKILSHKGYWKTAPEQNTPVAFSRSFEMGFGTATDLRDLKQSLVVAHDPPGKGALEAGMLFEIHKEIDPALTLALNIRADGLQDFLRLLVNEFALKNYFVFNMSVPDAMQWLRVGVPVFTRHSDVEPHPALYSPSTGVWIDSFHSDWWDADTILDHRDSDKKVCIASPELHGRPHLDVWRRLRDMNLPATGDIMLCTDFPEDAREFFEGED